MDGFNGKPYAGNQSLVKFCVFERSLLTWRQLGGQLVVSSFGQEQGSPGGRQGLEDEITLKRVTHPGRCA